MTASKAFLKSYFYNQFPDEYLTATANIEFIERAANAISANKSTKLYRTGNFILGLSTTLRACPTALYSSVLGYLSDPRPSRCCRSRTSKP